MKPPTINEAGNILSRYVASGKKRWKWLDSLPQRQRQIVESYPSTKAAVSACAAIIGTSGGSVSGIQKGLALMPKSKKRVIQSAGGKIGGAAPHNPKGFANMAPEKEKQVRLAAQEAKRKKYQEKLAAMSPAEREKVLKRRARYQAWQERNGLKK